MNVNNGINVSSELNETINSQMSQSVNSELNEPVNSEMNQSVNSELNTTVGRMSFKWKVRIVLTRIIYLQKQTILQESVVQKPINANPPISEI